MRIQPLSIEEHGRVSAEIQQLKRTMDRIFKLVNGRIPAALLDKLIALEQKHISTIQSKLEDEMFKRHRGHEGCTIHVYYPPDPCHERPEPQPQAEVVTHD